MTDSKTSPQRTIRWWPAGLLVVAMIFAVAWVWLQNDWPFQQRNLVIAQIVIITLLLLVGWWTFFSRASIRLRLGIAFGFVGTTLVCPALFRVRGVSGDLLPIVEFRWAKRSLPTAATKPVAVIKIPSDEPGRADFPQFLGPNRDGVLPGPRLQTNWLAHPPEVVWRQKMGAAWSGFAIVGEVGLTQEQRGENECVVAYELRSGKELWQYASQGRYDTVIAGEGPRATPTVVSNRVFACGGTGRLHCLDLASGKLLWSRDLMAESDGKLPQWGYSCSPLVADGLVIVYGGDGGRNSLLAFRAGDGTRVWAGDLKRSSYASPVLATLAGRLQVIAFTSRNISAHDFTTGATLWERPWGNGNVVCASPVIVSSNRVLFSSGYGVGAELLEISRVGTNQLAAQVLWKSIRMKSKFAHLFARKGSLYGLDDGILACVNLADGAQCWKEGRYGHGQGLLVADLYLLMAESGELVLLRPTPEAPNELARFPVFHSKTWNPIALAGDLLLVRNEQEAACLRLTLAP